MNTEATERAAWSGPSRLHVGSESTVELLVWHHSFNGIPLGGCGKDQLGVPHTGFRFQPDDSPLEQLAIVAVATLERSWQPTSCAGDLTVQYSTVLSAKDERSEALEP